MAKKDSTVTQEEKQMLLAQEPQVPMELDPVQMFAEDAGQGFEKTQMDDYVVPFITILQKMSPQCDEDSPLFIEGAKPGLFYNTANQKLFETLKVVPCSYQRMFAEWVPRDSGGGFRGHHLPMSDEVLRAEKNRDERGKFQTGRGTYLSDTRYHFVILLTNNQVERAVIAMASTQIKKSRLWMTAMRDILLDGPGGKKFTPPMFSHIYTLSTISESNDQGTWKGFKIEIDRALTKAEASVYQAAKLFRQEVEAGRVNVDDSQTMTTHGDGEEIPF